VGGRGGDVIRRLDEMNASCKLLKVSTVCVADFEDQRLSSTPELEVNKVIEEWLDYIKPFIILTHSRHDVNSDHRAVARSVLVAIRTRSYVHEVFGGEGEWADHFDPDCHFAIGEAIQYKMGAVRCYASEAREKPHPRSLWGVMTRAGYHGQKANSEYGEAYETILRR
jgi:LmbE family N-acetylglucosaminyl deacetylase